MARRVVALTLAAALAAPAVAVAAGWGGIEPGATTQDKVRELYGPPTQTIPKKIEGYDTVEWLYEGQRAPRGFLRMSIEFGLLAQDGYKPQVVRTLRLDPKSLVFGRDTVMQGWGLPDQIGKQGKHDVFLYEAGLIVTFDERGLSAANMLFMVPQKLPTPEAAPQPSR